MHDDNVAWVDQTSLRARFAQRMSNLYATEVPAYGQLLTVAAAVNRDAASHSTPNRMLSDIGRVTAERHGAIRIGTPNELRQVGRIFAGFGMYPVGFYDLRDGARSAVPVVSTAFRPIDPDELASNPFRIFTSLLVTNDRRFFTAELQARLETFLARRTLFPDAVLLLADKASRQRGLHRDDAAQFVTGATACFALSTEPIDRGWHTELAQVSAVAADIGAHSTTHINHLTPRVLDIDELYRRMVASGVDMIDTIQGPPRWNGPDVLLRQTSFRALAEPATFRTGDGTVSTGSLRVRFGEVESRGMALTDKGRDLYDEAIRTIDHRTGGDPRQRHLIAPEVWRETFPSVETEYLHRDLAFFTFEPGPSNGSPVPPAGSSSAPAELVAQGTLSATPIVYEDFLPRSAAAIFRSNLDDDTVPDERVSATHRDQQWLSDVLNTDVLDPVNLYAQQQAASLAAACKRLGVAVPAGG